MACLVGIDYGIKRTGLSYTDPNQIIASGLTNLPTSAVLSYLNDFCKKEAVEAFIVGQPIQRDGTPSDIEVQILEFIRELQECFPQQKVKRYDERFTSKMAAQAIREAGLKKKQRSMKGRVDQVSATLILQSYLDAQTNSNK